MRGAIVFVSASADDAHVLRSIAEPHGWIVVNVPDLTGARNVIEKLRPLLIVCDTHIEGPGCWRDLALDGISAGSALIVASRHADDELWSEVLNLGGLDLLDEPFSVDAVERAIGVRAQFG
jgi:CheY-like chemotaxis protein